MSNRILIAGLLGLLVGCDAGPQSLDDPLFPTGTASIVASARTGGLYVVNTDAGTLSRKELGGDALAHLDVGTEPTRVAPLGEDGLVVTLRMERAVAVVRDVHGALTLERKIDVGAEPYGVVATELGHRFYVSSSLAGRVDEYDGASFERLRSWDIEGEPRWMALTPSAGVLYVAPAFGRDLALIDLATGEQDTVRVPRVRTSSFLPEREVAMTPRFTGDLSISPDGRSLAIPVLYVDDQRPPLSDEPLPYGGDEEGPKFDPGCVVARLDGDGRPTEDEPWVLPVSGVDGDGQPVRAYPTSTSFSPDSSRIAVTVEASDVVAFLDRPAPDAQPSGRDAQGRSWVDVEFVSTGDGPRGFAFAGLERGWTDAAFEGQAQRVDFDVEYGSAGQADEVLLASHEVAASIEVASAVLPEDVAAGRSLFYSATSRRMSTAGSGVTCSTCHLDGRNDGLTWPLEVGPRQTPSLAGEVSLTEPVTWDGQVPTVADEAAHTAQVRMGGAGPTAAEIAQLQAFVDWTRQPDVPRLGEQSDSVLRGQALFERDDVGCSECHSGVTLTDNEPYAMFGLEAVNTRSLVGIAASAPYFHDGSSRTLEAVVERSVDGEMGDTSMLSAYEKADLVSFLESL